MRRVIVIGAVVLVVGGGSCIGYGALTAPRLAEAPELDAVDLTPPPAGPRSEALHAALSARYRAYEGLDHEHFSSQLVRMERGEWLEAPETTQTMIGAASSLPSAVRHALEAPGCLRHDILEDLEDIRRAADGESADHDGSGASARPLLLLRAVELMVLAEVARVQRGQQVPDAQRSLLELLRALRRHQDECPNALLTTMMLQRCISLVHAALGFLVADPEHDPAIWEPILDLESMASPMPKATRVEAAAMRQARTSELQREADDPWSAQLAAILERGDRRTVWLADLPPAHEALRAVSVEEAHDEALRGRSWAARLLFSDPVGAQAMAIIATGIGMHRDMITGWHEEQCRLALRRALWQRDLRARRRPVPRAAVDAPPRDLIRDEVILLEDPTRPQCTYDDTRPIRPEDLGQLPPFPPSS